MDSAADTFIRDFIAGACGFYSRHQEGHHYSPVESAPLIHFLGSDKHADIYNQAKYDSGELISDFLKNSPFGEYVLAYRIAKWIYRGLSDDDMDGKNAIWGMFRERVILVRHIYEIQARHPYIFSKGSSNEDSLFYELQRNVHKVRDKNPEEWIDIQNLSDAIFLESLYVLREIKAPTYKAYFVRCPLCQRDQIKFQNTDKHATAAFCGNTSCDQLIKHYSKVAERLKKSIEYKQNIPNQVSGFLALMDIHDELAKVQQVVLKILSNDPNPYQYLADILDFLLECLRDLALSMASLMLLEYEKADGDRESTWGFYSRKLFENIAIFSKQ